MPFRAPVSSPCKRQSRACDLLLSQFCRFVIEGKQKRKTKPQQKSMPRRSRAEERRGFFVTRSPTLRVWILIPCKAIFAEGEI